MKFLKIKKIDKLLFKAFLPPFLMAFFIAMFVLMMQFLWLYIDDIAGKGIGIFVLAEMIYYMGLSLIPMALPIAILLASVMVYGTLAEKYELPSMKTAGIPLLRVMRSSMIFAFLVACSSYVCSNYVIPYANLKFKSRLYDIKKQKPGLYLESGVFNDDFQGYSIRIGKKHIDGRTIEDVMIDDDQSNQRNQFNIIRADRGEMYVTDDDRFFVMNLHQGYQYQKAEPSSIKADFPFIRTSFKEWTKTFDLSEFDLRRTDENLFKSYHAMLSTRQLAEGIDSINIKLANQDVEQQKTRKARTKFLYYDSVEEEQAERDSLFELEQRKERKVYSNDAIVAKKDDDNIAAAKIQDLKPSKLQSINRKVIEQPHLEDLDSVESVIFTFGLDKRVTYLESLRSLTRSSKNALFEYKQKRKYLLDRRKKYTYQLHSKYGFAVVCFIFLFIGAPMGAIVRKGGFGYPLLVAIIFFMLFVVLNKVFEKLYKGSDFDPVMAAWLPCFILFPLGLFLTVKAMNDSKLLNLDGITAFFTKVLNRIWQGRQVA
ncbi:MAG: LptF/LptG family permease [Saprospiraceae bacterium]|nr:LptF/LptG family permease [Saprospiraceae bacterium]